MKLSSKFFFFFSSFALNWRWSLLLFVIAIDKLNSFLLHNFRTFNQSYYYHYSLFHYFLPSSTLFLASFLPSALNLFSPLLFSSSSFLLHFYSPPLFSTSFLYFLSLPLNIFPCTSIYWWTCVGGVIRSWDF